MYKWLIWFMCFISYVHTLDQLELSAPCYVLFVTAAVVAYLLWLGEK